MREFVRGRLEVPWRAHELLKQIAESVQEDDENAVIDLIEEIPAVRQWLTLDQFDRREVNRRLCQYANVGGNPYSPNTWAKGGMK